MLKLLFCQLYICWIYLCKKFSLFDLLIFIGKKFLHFAADFERKECESVALDECGITDGVVGSEADIAITCNKQYDDDQK